MLYTIYKVLYPGLEQVDQYYKWKIEFPEPKLVRENRAGPPKKIRGTTECPGCGRRVSYSMVYTDGHKCPGTLTDYPVKPRGIKPARLSASEQEQLLLKYVQTSEHAITFNDDAVE